jgi:D-serine deaminase-like pyridoxal phosphate-dependent protein
LQSRAGLGDARPCTRRRSWSIRASTTSLVPYNVVGGRKLEQLALLLERATATVTADDPVLLAGLGGAASDAGRELGILVDCDTGLGRTGVASPDEAAELAGAISRTPGLRFAGLLTFPRRPERPRSSRRQRT